MSWLCLQDGKDYIPLTADADASPVAPDPRSNRPQSREFLDVQLHYDSPPALRSASWLFIPPWFHEGRTPMDVCCLMSPVQRAPAGGALQSAPQHQDVWTHPHGKQQHHGALVELSASTNPNLVFGSESEGIGLPYSVRNHSLLPLQEGHTDIGMCFSVEDKKGLNQHLPTTPSFRWALASVGKVATSRLRWGPLPGFCLQPPAAL